MGSKWCMTVSCNEVMLGHVLGKMDLALAMVCYNAVYEISSSVHV